MGDRAGYAAAGSVFRRRAVSTPPRSVGAGYILSKTWVARGT